jgi:hypothetical protein
MLPTRNYEGLAITYNLHTEITTTYNWIILSLQLLLKFTITCNTGMKLNHKMQFPRIIMC